MIGLLVVFFPLALLAFMLFMERVEAPLRTDAVEGQVEDFLDHARPAEVDTLVRFGIRRAVEALRNRRRLSRRVPVESKPKGS
ncbi:MAG: hypothetical protein H0V10_18390 [Geodermatophilaceae bacterium]|nr:hypothetical protein [Geodermatophilaceae bacterium]